MVVMMNMNSGGGGHVEAGLRGEGGRGGGVLMVMVVLLDDLL
jgi:hypothetical protein